GLRRPLVVPAALRRALATSPKAKAAFERLSLSHRREHIQWITEAKRPETKAKRVAETVRRLAAHAAR
ncbi:MAG TPA: YdeI/OmpD-associated family protein, partial [bacterium]|nr:YdeI/OmpD-associated family protein [bacterium]